MSMALEVMKLIFAVLDVSFNSGHHTVISNLAKAASNPRENQDSRLSHCLLGRQESPSQADLDPSSRVCTAKPPETVCHRLTDWQALGIMDRRGGSRNFGKGGAVRGRSPEPSVEGASARGGSGGPPPKFKKN